MSKINVLVTANQIILNDQWQNGKQNKT